MANLDKKLKNGKISQEDYDAINAQKSAEDRFSNVGISKAINNGNYEKAAERARQATANYSAAAGYNNPDLMASLQTTYDADRNSKSTTEMLGAYGKEHPADGSTVVGGDTGIDPNTGMPDVGAQTGQDPAAAANNDVPDNVNQSLTQGVADTSKDVISKANDFLLQGEDYGSTANADKAMAFDPSTAPGADAYNQQIQNDLNTNLGYVDQLYNLDYDNPGDVGNQYLKASLAGGENLYNSGMQDSDTASGFYRDLGRDYTNSKLNQQNTVFNNAIQRKDTERTGVRSAAQNFSGQSVGQQNNANQMASNFLGQGLGGLVNANNMNLGNLGFERDTIENNYTNEQNSRLAFWNLLQNKQFMDKYGDDLMKSLTNPQGAAGGGFDWKSLIGPAISGVAMAL